MRALQLGIAMIVAMCACKTKHESSDCDCRVPSSRINQEAILAERQAEHRKARNYGTIERLSGELSPLVVEMLLARAASPETRRVIDPVLSEMLEYQCRVDHGHQILGKGDLPNFGMRSQLEIYNEVSTEQLMKVNCFDVSYSDGIHKRYDPEARSWRVLRPDE